MTLVGSLDKSRVSYRLNITAMDDGQCCGDVTIQRHSQGLIIVEIKDINNNAPKFKDCATYAPVVLEKENVGTFVIQVIYVVRYREYMWYLFFTGDMSNSVIQVIYYSLVIYIYKANLYV